ncbi:NAD(P)H-hydrate dehydratase [Marinovum sp.]|uniref:NAD(P)H-hydrate dehydratase n=1 Tax=Marinovum sp. TaxID=2024839 RepID=UPI003A9365AF
MRAFEQAAIASGKVTGLELMERAGAGVVEAVLEEWPELGQGAHRAVVLCGPGNNGGDGFVIARLLKERGWTVEVFLYGDPARLPPDSRTNHDRWSEMGETQPLTVEAVARGTRPEVLIDAMFGTGLSRAIPLDCANAFHAVKQRDTGAGHRCHTVAVDCPSGLDCDSGAFLVPARPEGAEDGSEAHRHWWREEASKRILQADLTCSFHRAKLGHYLGTLQTRLRLVDIGLGREDPAQLNRTETRPLDRTCLLEADRHSRPPGRVWPGRWLGKGEAGSHKYDHGHALVLSGGFGKTGAARLAARGALRIGAGLVTLGVPGSAQMEVASQITALMLRRVEDAEGLGRVLEDARINALCLGPGLGVERAKALVPVALGDGGPTAPPARGVVLDADALTAFREAPDALFDLLHPGCVLTPHGGEFARLFPDIAARLKETPTRGPAWSKVDATREAAQRAGCVVLFKGPATVIADPEGRCSVNAALYDRAAPWLATAGSGDVLAGMITGLLARGLSPMQAAEAAAWLHVEAARHVGPGLIAEDLPEALPPVLRGLGL